MMNNCDKRHKNRIFWQYQQITKQYGIGKHYSNDCIIKVRGNGVCVFLYVCIVYYHINPFLLLCYSSSLVLVLGQQSPLVHHHMGLCCAWHLDLFQILEEHVVESG